jgi:Ca2+-binding RTX toxin-like protein
MMSTITGTAASEFLPGTGSADAILGLAGDDTLIGYGGADTLDGGAGADLMEGGLGNDLYLVDDGGDTVVESTAAGTDTVQSWVTWLLAVNLENLTLAGSLAIHGTGNDLANRILGNAAANRLAGLAGADTLVGNAGQDTLDGGAGSDLMKGGTGNDLYRVDTADDGVVEQASAGRDTVQSGVTYALPDNVEVLRLVGVDPIDGTGNALDNVLTGNAAANLLRGSYGRDTLYGNAGNDTLSGDGEGGGDYLAGGAGDDIYNLWETDDGDVIFEDAGEGYDRVISLITFTLPDNVEYLHLAYASGNVSGYGNGLANVIFGNGGDNLLYGYGGQDRLVGQDGNDSLYGGPGDDNLEGGAGTDRMAGGAGDDSYEVDAGADLVLENPDQGYDGVLAYVSYTLPANVEQLSLWFAPGTTTGRGNGLDNFILGSDLGNRLYGGAGDDTLYAYAGNDTLWGGDGDDQLAGSQGADVLRGGLGNDTLSLGSDAGADLVHFETALDAADNVDRVQELTWVDEVRLDNDVFAALRAEAGGAVGALAADQWQAGAAANGNGAADAVGLWYDTDTGYLYYNPTAAVAGDSILFAILEGRPALSSGDFVLFD